MRSLALHSEILVKVKANQARPIYAGCGNERGEKFILRWSLSEDANCAPVLSDEALDQVRGICRAMNPEEEIERPSGARNGADRVELA